MISIIMPSYLGAYKKAATGRPEKLVRAINSVIGQTYKNWELVIVADGCEQTVRIVTDYFDDKRIKGFKIPKQKIWSGQVRNVGLKKCTGQWACYLDIDDVIGKEHLSSIMPGLKEKDWYYFDDWLFRDNKFVLRKASMNIMGKCGTSNLIHKPLLAQWNVKDGYAHDWNFIKNLKKASKNYGYIKGGYYYTCHIPGKVDI